MYYCYQMWSLEWSVGMAATHTKQTLLYGLLHVSGQLHAGIGWKVTVLTESHDSGIDICHKSDEGWDNYWRTESLAWNTHLFDAELTSCLVLKISVDNIKNFGN